MDGYPPEQVSAVYKTKCVTYKGRVHTLPDILVAPVPKILLTRTLAAGMMGRTKKKTETAATNISAVKDFIGKVLRFRLSGSSLDCKWPQLYQKNTFWRDIIGLGTLLCSPQ